VSGHVTLLRERSHGLEMVLVIVVPVVYGAIVGVLLGVSEPAYVVTSLLGILGGFVAGLEHEGALEGFYRGMLGGLLFGVAILTAHGIADEPAKAHLPDPEILLVTITTGFGAALGAAGGWVRTRRG
jgi:hypothetical protein